MNNNAHNLETILDNCITAVLEEGQTVKACLAQFPDQRDVLEPLLQITVRLHAAHTLQPAPEFRQVAATRMQNLIAAHPHRQPSGDPPTARWPDWRTPFITRRRPAWAGLVGFLVVFCLLLGTLTVSAAADTIPGETLYPVKRLTEQTHIALTFNNLKKARLHLRLADQRLQETADLLAVNQDNLAEATLRDFVQELSATTMLLDASGPLTPADQQILAKIVADNLAQYERKLAMWQTSVPSEMETAVLDAITTLHSEQMQALFLLGEGPDPTLPTATPTSTTTPFVTPSQTPTTSPTATETATAVPSATPIPTTPAPTTTATPHWQIPPGWPANCPIPSDWPPVWPNDCPIPPVWPTDWPTPPGGWPVATETPALSEVEGAVPTQTPLPTIAPPAGWPADCPYPPDLSNGWPDGCPNPSDWDTSWPTPPGGWPNPSDFWPTPAADWPTPPPISTAWPTLPNNLPSPPDLPGLPELPKPPGGSDNGSGGWPSWP